MLSPTKDESVLMGASHPGQHVFSLNKALRYFNQYTILGKNLELEDDDQFYLEENNLCYAAEKMLDIQLENIAFNEKTSDMAIGPQGLRNNKTDDYNQLVGCLQQDVTLMDGNDDSVMVLTQTPGKSVDKHSTDKPDTQPSHPNLDLLPLLWLISVAPEPAASHCKRLMDRDQLSWKVSLYDVLMVFLNWGATLRSLGLEEAFGSSHSIFSPEMPCPFFTEGASKVSFPSPRNVYLVLSTVSERLPPDSAMPLHERTLLLLVLVRAATDRLQRCNLYHWTSCVQAVVDSIDDWSEEKADQIVSHLCLATLGAENAAFVVCSVFRLVSSRLNTLCLFAGHNVLAQLYDFPPEISLTSIADSLLPPSELLERFQLGDVFFITSLVHSLLIRHMDRSPTPSQEVIDVIHLWTVEVRDSLKKFPFKFNLQSGALRERLSRLTSECKSIQRRGQPCPTGSGINLELSSAENSPCKLSLTVTLSKP